MASDMYWFRFIELIPVEEEDNYKYLLPELLTPCPGDNKCYGHRTKFAYESKRFDNVEDMLDIYHKVITVTGYDQLNKAFYKNYDCLQNAKELYETFIKLKE